LITLADLKNDRRHFSCQFDSSLTQVGFLRHSVPPLILRGVPGTKPAPFHSDNHLLDFGVIVNESEVHTGFAFLAMFSHASRMSGRFNE
jgi:hypothetical protein